MIQFLYSLIFASIFLFGTSAHSQDMDLTKKTFIQLINMDEARFYKLRPISNRKIVNVKLNKVEKFNATVGVKSSQFIKYRSVQETVERGDLEDKRDLLVFEFYDMSAQQFAIVKNLYGGLSTVTPKEGLHTYTLSDFMPPLIQALEGHAFLGYGKDMPLLNETTLGKRDLGYTNIRAQALTNCWGTAYELMAQGSFLKGFKPSATFNIFYISDVLAEEALRKYGTLKASQSFSIGQNISIKNLKLGDVILIRPVHTSESGKSVPVLEHVAISIDDGIVFEKANADAIDPYRFTTLDETVHRFFNRHEIDIQSVQLDVLSFLKRVPSAREEFGGYKNALDRDFEPKDHWRWPLTGRLNELFILSKSWVDLDKKYWMNSFNFIFDVELEQDSQTGHYQLAPSAYLRETFEPNLLIEKLK